MPSFGNRGLRKYEDRFYVSGIGTFSFAIRYHDLMALSRLSEAEIEGTVRKSADALAARIRSNAPHRFGDLQRGIVTSATAEKSAAQGKVVFDVTFDAAMNDKFVKLTKTGKRYYYPASQEYGFRIGRTRRKPGLYFMRDTAIEFYSGHENAVVDGVVDMLEDL